MEEKVYRIEGDYLESCNCAVVCPCLVNGVGNNKIPATDWHCDLFLGYTIKKGHYKDIDLSGLNFVMACYSPGPLMSVPNWAIAHYIDDNATDEQYEALKTIMSGEAGGVPSGLAALMEIDLGYTRAKITMDFQELSVDLSIDGIAECRVDAITGMHDGEPVKMTNIHPQTQNGDCIQGLNGQMWYRDHNYTFNNTGRSALFAKYIWADTSDIGLKA